MNTKEVLDVFYRKRKVFIDIKDLEMFYMTLFPNNAIPEYFSKSLMLALGETILLFCYAFVNDKETMKLISEYGLRSEIHHNTPIASIDFVIKLGVKEHILIDTLYEIEALDGVGVFFIPKFNVWREKYEIRKEDEDDGD